MEGDGKSAVIIETGQEVSTLDVNKSGEAQLLSDGQNELQGAVIIYDNESQEGQVVKLITNIKSEDHSSDQNPNPDNVITLHASSNDSKDETIENVVAVPSQQTIKTEALNNPEGGGGGEDAEDEDDDETIATFVTSTGQQLALYAVEDSDEIFAVALYDESGEPPTNFHFLMKADVERLIGEGAVKTVKKPSAQTNKQPKPAEDKKEEEIKFEKVAAQAPLVVAPAEKKEDILEKSLAGIKQEIMDVCSSPEKVQEVVVPATPSPPKVQQEVVKVVQKKESPAAKFVVTKNNSINNVAVKNVTPTAAAKKPATQIRQIVTQAKPATPQTKVITTPNRTYATYQSRPTQVRQVIAPGRQLVATHQPRQIVAQRQIIPQQSPRQIITQQRQIIGQPTRQIVTQQRKLIAQPTRQIVAQQQQPTRQLIIPARQYVNQKQYGRQQRIVYQAKPQQMRTAITPIKKPVVASQKEKVTYVVQNQEESFVVDLDSDAEILEQSTVQYILCDENPTDTECLTFDELQASIQSFKTGKSPAATTTTTTTTTKVELPKPKKESSPAISKFLPTVRSTPKSATILTPKKQQPITTAMPMQVYRTYKNPKKARTTNNLLQANRKIIKQEVVDSSYGDFDDTHDMSDADVSQSRQNSTLDSSSGVSKAKRSRKQQLTVVNRGDSEIIIQPASAYSEEEEEPLVQKRRGRRKKKTTPDPDYTPRQPQKKGRRSTRSVEVIDIDVDEAERANVITLDGKKGSSDKENDVISVGDTDEEDDAAGPRKKKVIRKPMMQCSHCMRNFRKRRALERHVQICPKSPAYLEKLEERKKLGVDKKFKCKSCDEYFDIAVSLARHVRVVHSPRKRGRPPKGWAREDKSESDETDESMGESSPEREVVVGPKKRGRPPRKSSVVADKEIVTADVVVEKSPAPEGDSKSEAPADSQQSQPQPSSSEPRRRGRPPGKRSFYVERSVTPEVQEDKPTSSDSTTRKRGRAAKRSMSQEGESEDIEGEASESLTLPKKRGRPKKKSVSKDEEIDNPEGEEKIEDASSTEPKKRGRRSRRTVSRDEEDAKSTASEDKLEDESSKKQKASEEESDKNEPTKKRGRPARDKLISIKEEKIIESSEAETETEEPRKRGRPSRSSESEPSKKIKAEVEEMEEVVLSPSQTGKLKKLNCSECGKWFSSVNLLNNHQIEHRTKKSGILVNRCPDCNALVPINLFVKHMAMQHNKTVQVASTSKADGTSSSTSMTITTQVQSADNKTVKVVQQRSLRSSN